MSVLIDILNLLTVPPGGMVYYLVLLLSIWAIVGLALSRWSRQERRGIVPRLLVAGAVMSFGRLVLFVLALLDRQNGTYLISFGPPLERFIDMLSGLLICWALIVPPEHLTFGRVFLGMTSLFAAGLYVISAMYWADAVQSTPGLVFNLSWQRWAWELGQLIFLIPALAYLFVSPTRERGTLIVALSVLIVGHLLQAVLPLADQIPYLAGWVRFANLLAFPLLAVIVFRTIVQRFDTNATNLQAVSQESLAQITGLMDLLDINQKMSSTLDLDTILNHAIRSISQALQSNLCALALVPQDDPESLDVSILYSVPNITQDYAHIQRREYPAIQYALVRKKPVILESSNSSQVQQVYHLLGSEQKGPLIVQPMKHNDRMTGAILICRPGQSAPFTAIEARKCETLAMHIGTAIENARQHKKIERELEQQTAKLRTIQMEHSRAKADLENRLRQSQEEVALYVQKLYETELSEQRAQNDAQEIRQQLNALKREKQANTSQIREELQQSMEQTTLLTQRIAELDATRLKLEHRVQTLQKEKKGLQSRLQRAQAVQSDLQARISSMRSETAKNEQAKELDLSMLDHMTSGVILCDEQGSIQRINPAATRILDGNSTEWIGKAAHTLWPSDEWKSAIHLVTDHYPGQNAEATVVVMQHGTHSIQAELIPLHIQGRHAGALILLYVIPEINAQTRARDEFLASLAQDLRTPMTSILGYTDLLMSESVGQLEGIQRKFLQRVQANIERMGGMLNDMIGVTAIDSGKLVIELEPVDVMRVLESALRKVQFRLEEKDLNTHLEIADMPVIQADPECVQQIMDNLLNNACKSSQPGSTIEIKAHVESDDHGSSHLHVSVSDTGGGVAQKDRARVFERFYRAGHALIAGLGETGVGLSIVKALVEAHQGHVWIESQVGMGTTFHFTLPFGLGQPAENQAENKAIPPRPIAGGNGYG